LIKILVCADSPNTHSGYANQADEFAERMASYQEDFKVHYLGFQFYGKQIQPVIEGKLRHYLLWANLGSNPFGADVIQRRIVQIKPDLIWMLMDYWMGIPTMQRIGGVVPICFWFPVDGYPLVDHQKWGIEHTDIPVCFSDYAQNVCRKFGYNVHKIYHGVNLDIFCPRNFEEVQAFKANLGLTNYKIILMVFRNQERKGQIPTLKALSKFLKDKNDVKCLFWTDVKDRDGFNLIELRKLFKLEGKLLFPQDIGYDFHFMDGFNSYEMALLYNISEFGLYLTIGEGFNIPIIESQACGKPCIVSAMTSHPMLVNYGRCGELVRIQHLDYCKAGVDRWHSDPNHATEILQYWYENPNYVRELGEKAREYTYKKFDWNKLQEQWRQLILREMQF
jgi:glycosyltransferase involved in cell wall biosynthesis